MKVSLFNRIVKVQRKYFDGTQRINISLYGKRLQTGSRAVIDMSHRNDYLALTIPEAEQLISRLQREIRRAKKKGADNRG